MTRLRRADTRGDKINHLKYFDSPGEAEDCETSPWGDQYRALHVPHAKAGVTSASTATAAPVLDDDVVLESGGDECEYCDRKVNELSRHHCEWWLDNYPMSLSSLGRLTENGD